MVNNNGTTVLYFNKLYKNKVYPLSLLKLYLSKGAGGGCDAVMTMCALSEGECAVYRRSLIYNSINFDNIQTGSKKKVEGLITVLFKEKQDEVSEHIEFTIYL